MEKDPKKFNKFPFLWNNFCISWEKFPTTYRRFVKCSHLFYIFSNSSEINLKIWSIFLKSMKNFHFL